MSTQPDYKFEFRVIDKTSGETVIADDCSISTIDDFGGCEMVDMHVSSTLRAFNRKIRAEHERKNYQNEEA